MEETINNELVTLTLPNEDEEVIYRLKSEDEFACRYLINLINTGYISLAQPVMEIYRIDDENETLLYSSDAVDVEPTEQNIGGIDDTIKKAEWTEAETKRLLDLYEENIPRVGPMRKYKNKKNMWQDVTDILNKHFKINRTARQVENRYKTVLKRKKAAVENNIRSGSLHKTVPYEFELNKIGALDDSIEPEVLGSPSGIRILKPNNSGPIEANSLPSTSGQELSTSSDTKSKLVLKPVRNTETDSQRKRRIERRHREKLDLLREIFKK